MAVPLARSGLAEATHQGRDQAHARLLDARLIPAVEKVSRSTDMTPDEPGAALKTFERSTPSSSRKTALLMVTSAQSFGGYRTDGASATSSRQDGHHRRWSSNLGEWLEAPVSRAGRRFHAVAFGDQGNTNAIRQMCRLNFVDLKGERRFRSCVGAVGARAERQSSKGHRCAMSWITMLN
jgi:hypothetical protein